jgi:hypothetical protein
MRTAEDRVTGLLSCPNEWRKSRLLLVVMILCGLGQRGRMEKKQRVGTASGTGVWGDREAAKVGA